ncbi:MAG: cadherin-like domain-containing protein, partial [Planctomycetes bacterium]|nr:cadherin-like domain-containing protein [Planctomycetota bacterium]
MLSNLVLGNDAFTIANNGGGQTLDVLVNDVDSQGGTLRLVGLSQPAHGAAVIAAGLSGSRDTVVFTPTGGYTGNDSFNYTVQGNDGKTKTASVQLMIQAGSGNLGSSSPPSLVNLRLANPTGAVGSSITTDAHIAGTLVTSGSMVGLTVQFDFNNDATVDATATQINADGSFSFDVGNPGNGVPGVAYGTVNLHVRGVQTLSGQSLVASWQSLSFSYQAPASATPAVTSVRLVNDTGTPNDLITTDPRIAGATSFTGSVSGLTIQVDTNQDGTSDLTTTTAPDGSFQINVAQQNSTGPGISYGSAKIAVRAGTNGNFGTWQPFSFTYQAPPVPPSIQTLSLVNDTGTAGDSLTTDPRIAGQFSGGSGSAASLSVQVDYNGDGIAEATTTTDQTGNFSFDPRQSYGTTPPLAYGNRTLAVRAGSVDPSANQLSYGAWANISFSYVQPPVVSQVINLHLANDTGAPGDGFTSDATVAGSLTNTTGATGLVVQYDYNGDGVPDVSAAPNSDGSFTLNMGQAQGSTPAIAYGNITVKVRAGKNQSDSAGKLYGDWQTLSYVYIANPPGSQGSFYVDQLRLMHDIGTNGNPASAEASITGYVVGASNPANLPIEYDLNGDGIPDGSTTTTDAGTFLVDLNSANLTPGTVAVKVRAKQTDANGVTSTSNWTQFSFAYTPLPTALVGNLHLVQDIGTAGHPTASQPVVAGLLTLNNVAMTGTAVEYGWNTSDEPMGTAYTASDGTFVVDLSNDPALAAGPVTVYFRGVYLPNGASSSSFSSWQAFQFTYAPVVFTPPSVTNLHLVNDTSTASDPNTHDPCVGGALTNNGGSLNDLPVQYDVNGDGNADGIVYTDASGNFVCDPRDADIPDGATTINIRSYVYDTVNLKFVYGNWTALSFNYVWVPPTPPAVQNLRVVNADGTTNTSSTVANATVVGALASTQLSVSHVAVQIALTDGKPIGTIYSDDKGKFTADLNDLLTPGSETIEFRTAVWDKHTGDLDFGAWQTISFNWAPPLFSVPIVNNLHLTHDTSSPNVGVTSDPRVSGTAARDNGALSDVRVYYDSNGDGIADGEVNVEPVTGKFTFDPSGPQLAEGTVTIQVQAEAQNPLTGEFLTSDWTPLTFTYSVPPLTLSDVTGTTAATCPIGVLVSGTALLPVGYEGDVLLEYSVHGTQIVDGSNLVASSDGTFQFVIGNDSLPTGLKNIYVRTTAYDSRKNTTTFSNWITVPILAPSVDVSPLTVRNLALVGDTGTGSSSSPQVQGAVSGSGALNNVPVQYELNGNTSPDGTVNTDLTGNGSFIIDLRQAHLSAGPVTVRARAGRFASGTGYSYGAWSTFTFTYQPVAADSPATVDSLSVASGDPETSGAAQLGIQDDVGVVHISGHISRAS